MSVNPLIGGVAIGTCYIIPRAVRYFCTKPSESDSISRINQVRERLSKISETISIKLGKKTCYYMRIIADNVWMAITLFFLLQMKMPKFVGLEDMHYNIQVFLEVCMLATLTYQFFLKIVFRNKIA